MLNSINYKNIQVAFSSEGKGQAIVLLHGFLENSKMWNDVKNELIKQNRVICVDLLGHGKTDDLGYVHTMEEMAMLVKSVLNHLKIRRVTLIGHSMGGYVALAFAEKYLKNVKGLCLLNSTAQADDNERQKNRLRAIKMAKTNYKSLVTMSIANLFTSKTRTVFSSEIELCKTEALKIAAKTYIACTEGMRLRTNREHILSSEVFKKLIIVGKKDPVLSYNETIKEAKRTNTPIIEFSNGHMSHIENKSELIQVLKDFIKQPQPKKH